MTDNMLARMMLQARKDLKEVEPQVKPPKDEPMGVDGIWLTPPVWALRWKRLMTLISIMKHHAATGAVLEIVELRREELAREALKRAAAFATPKMAAYLDTIDPNAISGPPVKAAAKAANTGPRPLAKGKALSRSTTKAWELEVANCPHPTQHLSEPRGGRGGALWLTCLKCGARWERVLEPEPKIVLIPQPPSAPTGPPVRTTNPTPEESSSDNGFTIVQEPTPVPATLSQQLKIVYDQCLATGYNPVQAIQHMMTFAGTDAEIDALMEFRTIINRTSA
jgi:hypothetical protein